MHTVHGSDKASLDDELIWGPKYCGIEGKTITFNDVLTPLVTVTEKIGRYFDLIGRELVIRSYCNSMRLRVGVIIWLCMIGCMFKRICNNIFNATVPAYKDAECNFLTRLPRDKSSGICQKLGLVPECGRCYEKNLFRFV